MTAPHADPAALRASLRALLPHPAVDAIDAMTEIAGPSRPIFAVGGTVRDLLLGLELRDVDLATEGDAAQVLRAALPQARVTAHQRFGTATAVVAGTRIDLVTARRETYARPGALPATEPASIADDLRRRDFGCNALALRLNGPPALLDPTGGLRDIELRHVRVLHERSFEDDPTRIFRAFRYAARLDFTLEARTASLLASALPYFRRVGGERLRRDLELMLHDVPSGAALESAHTAGALQAIEAALHWSRAKSEAYEEPLVPAKECDPYGLALLASGANEQEADTIVGRLKLKRDEAASVRGVASLRRVSELLRRPQLKPSGAAMLLDRCPLPAIAAYAHTTGNTIAREIMLRYLQEWREMRPLLSGRDLIEMGVPPGPQVQQVLQLVRAARLDGWAHDRDAERALIERFVRSIRESRVMHSMVEFEPRGD